MAKETENYNQSITTHLESIDNDRLLKIANDVASFTKNYNNYLKKQSQDSYFKQIISQSVAQSKTLNKMLEESVDSKNAQKSFQKKQEQYSERMKDTNQNIIKGLSDISRSTDDNVKNIDKLNKLTQEVQKENAQARLQELIKDNKRFRLESKYWKELTGGIKGMAAEFHDFKKNPSQWMSEALGDILGKALDKSIDVLKTTLDAGLKAIAKGFGDLKNSIFDMMAEQKRRAESIAQDFNRDYLEASGALNKSNSAVALLAQRGELDISRTSKNVDVITSKLLRRFGDELKDMSQEEYNQHFKAYAQLINAGAADKIDEIEEIAAGNEKLMSDMIKAETQLAGIRSRQDLRIQKGMEAVIITAEEAHKLGITYEQSVRANEKNQIFIAKVLASNKELGVEEVRAFTSLQKALMSQDFVSNILDDKNVNLSQLIGIDSNQAKKILTSGSDKDRLDFMNRIIQSGAYNEIPALKRMMEELGFDAQSLNVLSKQGKLKIDDESIKKITDAQKTDFSEFNAVLLSSGSKINEEIRTRISMLSAEGIRDENDNLTDFGKIQVETLREFNTFEKLLRENTVSKEKEDIDKARDLYKLMSDYSKGNFEAIKKFSTLSEADKKLAKEILDASMESKRLVEDQIQVSETLSEAQDLGLDKALSGGGLQGLFSGLLDVGMKSAYSPTYQDKLEHFMDNIKKSIEPAVNIFKELLIDPILDSLHDVIGKLLGEIYVCVQKVYSKISGDTYSKEKEQYDRLKFTSTKDRVMKDVDKLSAGRTVGSEDYMSMLKNIGSTSMEQIESNRNLSTKEKNNLLYYKAITSKELNSGGTILGSSTISGLDLTDELTRQNIQSMLSRIYFEGDLENGKIKTRGAENLNEIMKNSSSVLFNDPEGMIDFLSVDSSIKKSELKSVYGELKKQVGTEFGNDLNELFGLSGMGKLAGAKYSDAKQILAAYLLLNSGYDLLARKTGVGFFYELVPHHKDANNHFQLRSGTRLLFGEPEYFASGGVVGATKGGQHIIVGEAGHDEIIIPTDPAKRERAQELLRLAEENYGLYSQSPDSISDSLQQKLEELLFDIRILMIQLDPMKDAIASQALISAMGLLKNIDNINNAGSVSSSQTEEVNIGGGSYDSSVNNLSPVGGMPKQTEEEKIQYDAAVKALESWGGGRTKPAEFIQLFGPIAREDMRQSGVPASVTLAQAALETGWGKSAKPDFRNLFGIKGVGPAGSKTVWTHEVYNGVRVQKQAAFRAYNNYLESITDHSNYLRTAKRKSGVNGLRYGAALGFPFAPDVFAEEIHKAGYATSPTYSQKLKSIMRTNNMYAWNLSPDSNAEQAIGTNPDGSLIYSSDSKSNMSYNPSLQSIPDASGVSTQVDRANKAKLENEKKKAEEKQNSFVKAVKDIEKKLGTEFSDKVSKPINIRISDDKAFCTTGQPNCSPDVYGVA